MKQGNNIFVQVKCDVGFIKSMVFTCRLEKERRRKEEEEEAGEEEGWTKVKGGVAATQVSIFGHLAFSSSPMARDFHKMVRTIKDFEKVVL